MNRVSTYETIGRFSHSKTMFVGDSIVDGCEWNELLNRKVMISNRGINSDRLEGVLKRLSSLIDEKPENIFLLVGINNLQHGSSDDYICEKYEQILEKLKEKLPQSQIYVISILPVSEEIALKTKIGSNERIEKLNNRLAGLVKEKDYVYIDCFHDLIKDGTINKKYSFDGLHPNGEGYTCIKYILERYIIE